MAEGSPLADATRRFLTYSAVERGLAPRTLEAYERDLARFGAYLEGVGVRAPEQIERVHLSDFDYAGTPQADSGSSTTRGRHSRSPRGMGSRSAAELTPEELEKLLNFDG